MRDKDLVDNFSVTNNLEINELVDFEIIGGRFEGEYSTQIADVISENEFVVNAPFTEGKPINVPVGGRGEVKVGDRGGIYILPVKVTERKFDNTNLLVLKLRDKVRRIQEREFFRLEIQQETNYRLIAESEKEFDSLVGIETVGTDQELILKTDKELPPLETPCRIRDISAGGVKISTKEELKANQVVQIDFEFADVSFETLFGKIIRVEKKVRDEIIRYESGIEFLNSNRQYRDDLTQWLFAKQRELRQKGLI